MFGCWLYVCSGDDIVGVPVQKTARRLAVGNKQHTTTTTCLRLQLNTWTQGGVSADSIKRRVVTGRATCLAFSGAARVWNRRRRPRGRRRLPMWATACGLHCGSTPSPRGDLLGKGDRGTAVRRWMAKARNQVRVA